MAWEARWLAKQPGHRLGGAEARRRGGRPEVLDAGGPARYVLGAGLGVKADVGGVPNVHAKQRELREHGTPAQLGGCCRCVSLLHVPVRLLHDRAAYLELGRGLWPVHEAVQQDPRIALQMVGLHRSPHHREPQLAVHDQRLPPADTRRTVTGDRAHQQRARFDQLVVGDLTEHRMAGRYLSPSHDSCLLRATDGTGRTGCRPAWSRRVIDVSKGWFLAAQRYIDRGREAVHGGQTRHTRGGSEVWEASGVRGGAWESG